MLWKSHKNLDYDGIDWNVIIKILTVDALSFLWRVHIIYFFTVLLFFRES